MATPSKPLFNFKTCDLVWAKMKGFPPWPGLITEPPEELKKAPNKKNTTYFCVFFFGTKNYSWIETSHLKPYQEFKDELMKTGKSLMFREACDGIEDYIAKGETGVVNLTSSTLDEAFDRLVSMPASPPKQPKKFSPKKSDAASTSSSSSSSSKKRPSSPTSRDPFKKKKRSRVGSDDDDSSPTSPPQSDPKPPESYSSSLSSSSGLYSGSYFAGAHRRGPGANLLDRPPNISRPETPPLNLKDISQTLKEKNITPSPLKFGFLGLGIMGSGIVKNLLNSGHKVIVWNRTPEKYKEFKAAGAETAQTPSDVVQAADITFSCVSDPQAAKDLVFGNCGVLGEINSSKAYVEMTGIDADTSVDLAESITSKGGRYLEAQLQGSKLQAEEGTTVILSAGDRSLYDECHSCFEAFGRSSFFLGDVGNASKMNLVIQLMTGISLAGLAEGMALADRAGLQQGDVLEVINLTALSCPLIAEKGRAIIDGGFPTHLPLQHLQKDLKLSLVLSDQLEQPLPLTASANEVFKHAKRLGYGDHDASAVYIRARF